MSSPKRPKTPRAVENDVRRARREEKLGEDRICLLDGESDVSTLIRSKVRRDNLRGFLDDHHVVFAANDPQLVVTLCRNCHAKVHAGLLDEGLDPKDKEDRMVPEVVAIMLRVLGHFLHLLAEAVIWWAGRLEAFAQALPQPCREIPEAVW